MRKWDEKKRWSYKKSGNRMNLGTLGLGKKFTPKTLFLVPSRFNSSLKKNK